LADVWFSATNTTFLMVQNLADITKYPDVGLDHDVLKHSSIRRKEGEQQK